MLSGALVGNEPKLSKLEKSSCDGKHRRQKFTVENRSPKVVRQSQSAAFHQKLKLEMGGRAITLQMDSKEQYSSGNGCQNSWTGLK